MLHIPFHHSRKNLLRKAEDKLEGARVFLRAPRLDDYEQWSALRARSEKFLKPWEPSWPYNALSQGHYHSLVQYYDEGKRKQTYRMFFVFEQKNNMLVGGISLGNIRKGVVQSGQLGYWCGAEFAGQGYMLEGLRLLIAYAFRELKLHRLEAAVIPANERSIKLLERCGFKREGLLRSYVKINDQWEDHLLYAFLENDVMPDSEKEITS